MAANRATLEEAPFEEDRDLFEMANLYSRTTGLPVTIWVRPKGKGRHDVRIKVSATPGDRMDLDNTAVVAVRPRPALLHGEFAPAYLDPVLKWVSLNAPALTDYWNGTIDTVELGARLQRIDRGRQLLRSRKAAASSLS